MSSHPIFVRNIRHLTDARYFAAMGVDWMSIQLTNDAASFMLWHAIRGWVEGVNLAAEVDPANEELLAKVMIDAKPDGIVIDGHPEIELQTDIPCFYTLLAGGNNDLPFGSMMIVPYDTIGSWRTLAQTVSPDTLFLEAEWTKQTLLQTLSIGYTGGFCFSGEAEEITGIRDYSQMDDMIELLRMNNEPFDPAQGK